MCHYTAQAGANPAGITFFKPCAISRPTIPARNAISLVADADDNQRGLRTCTDDENVRRFGLVRHHPAELF